MTGYAIFNINVNNPENYKEYVEKVKPTAEKYGGEYLVLGSPGFSKSRTRDRL